ncbi:MAG TPA: hypothetical protein VMU69_06415 [Bradyrhizobium sp.]|nr:hypothetical protein [Bradyrhizobium sp.]
MSHHHMLQPIVYTPQVKPKKIETKKSRIRSGGTSALRETGEVFEASEPEELSPLSQLLGADAFVPIDGADRKPYQQGRLSDGTLKMMLQVQESGQSKLA